MRQALGRAESFQEVNKSDDPSKLLPLIEWWSALYLDSYF